MSTHPYRLCAIDLDDTLLGPDHRVSPANARAVQAVRAQGVQVMIASGRMHEATLPFARELELDTPVVSYNGAMVKHLVTGEVWLHERIPAALATQVLDYCATHGYQLNYYLNDRLYTAAETPWLQLYYERTHSPYTVEPAMATTLQDTEPTKLILIDTPERTDALLPFFREMFGETLYVTKSNSEYLEFMPAQANKGAAMALTAARLGVTAEETVVFGDSWNDIPMVQWAGLGIAVGNAKPELKAVADRTVQRNDEDGVAQALQELFPF